MQKDRKAVHKKVMKEIRRRNESLANDEYVGLNRFRIDMVSESMYRFSDGSGLTLSFLLKISDALTGNSCCFMANNYNYEYRIFEYANDFLIRCSDGWMGHYPPLHYVAYDVHEIVPYVGRKSNSNKEPKDGVICKYNRLNWDVLK